MRAVKNAAVREQMATYKKLNASRYYMVTFDLKGSEDRKQLYRSFDRRLRRFLGKDKVFRIIAQCYFVKSDFAARDVRTEMQSLLCSKDSILVVRLQPGRSFSLKKPGAGKMAKTFFNALKEDEGP